MAPGSCSYASVGHAIIETTHTCYVAGLADAQFRAVDAIEEAFLAPLLGRQGALAQCVLD